MKAIEATWRNLEVNNAGLQAIVGRAYQSLKPSKISKIETYAIVSTGVK